MSNLQHPRCAVCADIGLRLEFSYSVDEDGYEHTSIVYVDCDECKEEFEKTLDDFRRKLSGEDETES